jgi:hypothetical protein
MALYQFTTTALQEAALTRHVEKVNVTRRGNGQAAFADNQAFVTDAIVMLLRPVLDDFIAERVALVQSAYVAASPAQRAAAESALGL